EERDQPYLLRLRQSTNGQRLGAPQFGRPDWSRPDPLGGPMGAARLLLPTAALEAARSWKGWQRPTGRSAALPSVGAAGNPPPMVGDVVVVATGPNAFHVGFVFEVSTASGEFWMLGGNQRGGSRVSLARFNLSAIAV
ncbi:MAG: hypothetical protein ACKOD9_19220, partial [Rubrivivax sp.]